MLKKNAFFIQLGHQNILKNFIKKLSQGVLKIKEVLLYLLVLKIALRGVLDGRSGLFLSFLIFTLIVVFYLFLYASLVLLGIRTSALNFYRKLPCSDVVFCYICPF
jgi:hypothetical protein